MSPFIFFVTYYLCGVSCNESRFEKVLKYKQLQQLSPETVVAALLSSLVIKGFYEKGMESSKEANILQEDLQINNLYLSSKSFE